METKQKLFDFELKGEWADDKSKAAFDATVAMCKGMDEKPGKAMTAESAVQMRTFVESPASPSTDVNWSDEQKVYVEKCDSQEIEFDDQNCPDGKMKIIVHTPKTLDLTKKHKTIFWIHGGAFFLFTAQHLAWYACRLAVMNDCVVVSSFYRSPPEIRAPMYHLQSYYALKYTLTNADSYHIDSSRVCIHGESSGGMLAMAVAMELAKHDESHLIKYVLADVPACSFQWFRKPRESLREVESAVFNGHRDTFDFVGEDPEKTLDPSNPDPNVFPAEMADDIMAKLAPVYVTTREFDQYRLDSEYVSERLEKHGKLMELVIVPGTCHWHRTDAVYDMFKKIHDNNL